MKTTNFLKFTLILLMTCFFGTQASAKSITIKHSAAYVAKVKIDVTEPIGAETFVYFKLGGNNCCMRSTSGEVYQAGQTIEVGFEQNRIQFFDKETEKRLA